MNATLIMAKTFLKIFIKDRQSIFFTLFFPITFMAIFGFINTGEEEAMGVGIVDEANNSFSRAFIESLRGNGLFDVTVDSEETLRAQVIGGDMTLVLVLPEGFEDSGNPASVTMLVDAAQARQSAMLVPVIEQALLEVERQLRNTQPLFSLDVVDVQARSQRYIDFLVPGLLALTIMQISMAGSGYNIVEFRRKGILKRLFVTPLRPAHFIGGIVIARLLITLVQVCVLLSLAVLLLGVPIEGDPLSLLVFMLFGSSIFLSLGFFLGSMAKTQQAIMLMGQLVTLPQMFLSGVFYPIESMPDALQPAASLLPLSFLVTGLREIVVNGLDVIDLTRALGGMTLWLSVCLVLAIRNFVWKEVAS